ncbi:unknown [Blautia sp. CAG:52]|nr:unknown [Blautia sp. CAG:52]
MTNSCTLCRVCVNNNFTFVNNCFKFIFNGCIQNFTDMFQTESCSKCVFADTDTLHISLSCMVYTFDTVDVVMEFTLDNRFKVRLHVFTGNFNNICNAVFASQFHVVYFRSYNCDLMIFDLAGINSMNQLSTVNTGTIEFNLHVTTTNDLTFECGCECYRDIDVCDLDLDITSFQRCCIEFAYIFLNDQALRNSCDIFCFVGDYRESQCDSTSTTCYDYVIQRSECVNECRYTLHGVFHQSLGITRCYVTEDQSCSQCYGYYVNYRCNIFAQRNNTYVCACSHTCFCYLITDTAYQCYQDTLCLIRFYQCNTFFYCRSGSQDNSYTRDITCYKRYTQLTDHCICQMSV